MIFSASSVYPDILCIIHCLQSEKSNNLSDRGHAYELPDLWPPNNPDLTPVDYNNRGNESTRQKRRIWMIWGSIWLMCELEWNRPLLTTPLTSGVDVSIFALEPQEDIFNIHCDKD